MRHLRLALRTLFKTPFVTVVAILSLALGIGANSAIFSLFDQMLLRPLPVPNPQELVNFGAPGPKPGSQSCGRAGDCDEVFSYPMFRDLERVQTSFTGVASHRNFGASIGYNGTSLSGDGLLVSQIQENVAEDRVISTLSLAFALLATVLAAIGLYGVLAYTVAQRTREFGLRMALGADGVTVRGMVMKQVVKMAMVGGAIGLIVAVAVGRLAQSLLFELQGHDPLVLTASTVALAIVALGAGFIPALRASRIDPMNALRYE